MKPRVYFTSNVFTPSEIGSNDKISQKVRHKIKQLWETLCNDAEVKLFKDRFPSEAQLQQDIQKFNPNLIGCHLSHKISSKIQEKANIFAVCTSSAGYDHIQKTQKDDIIITHTPGILHETVADYTIALIMTNLRNIIDLHNCVWNNQWSIQDKWDLDQDLSSIISNKILGIIGLGEIGKELVKKLYSWNLKILYHDIKRMEQFEKMYPNIIFKERIEDLIKESDIISVHIPLNNNTEKFINRDLLKIMKEDALLINTARGQIIDFDALLDLLETRKIRINLAFDVFPIEPIDSATLIRIKNIKMQQPDIRIILMPHNASADAETRGKMNIMFLEDIIKLIESKGLEDLKEIHLIPEQKNEILKKNWKIYTYWNKNL